MEQTTQTDGSMTGTKPTMDFSAIIGDAEDLLRAVAHIGGESVAQARAQLQQRLTQVREAVNEGEQMARARARQAADATDRYVHDSPWQAIGIGLAVGIALGLMARR